MKHKVDNTYLKNIIHTIFTTHELSNADLECDETYNSIVDMIYDIYTDMLSIGPDDNSLTLLDDMNSFKDDCSNIYSRIHELLEERFKVDCLE